MVFCNSIDLGLVAKGVYASHRYLLLNQTKITNLLALLKLGSLLSASLLLALALLEEGLGDEDLVLGGNGAVRVSIVRPHKCENSAECKNCSYSATFSTEGQ